MPEMKADGYKVKAQGLPAVPPSALHPVGEEPRDWFSRKPCVQVAYKSATYTQGTRLFLTASRTAIFKTLLIIKSKAPRRHITLGK